MKKNTATLWNNVMLSRHYIFPGAADAILLTAFCASRHGGFELSGQGALSWRNSVVGQAGRHDAFSVEGAGVAEGFSSVRQGHDGNVADRDGAGSHRARPAC